MRGTPRKGCHQKRSVKEGTNMERHRKGGCPRKPMLHREYDQEGHAPKEDTPSKGQCPRKGPLKRAMVREGGGCRMGHASKGACTSKRVPQQGEIPLTVD